MSDVPNGRDFEALYDQYARTVTRWAARLGGPGIDAEDIAQEVFMVAHRRLDTLRSDIKPSTWLFGITTRVTLAQRRRQRLRKWLSADEGEAISQPAANGSTPLDDIQHRQALAMGYGILERMPEALRTAFILFEIDGLSTEEIAEVTGAKPTTIRVRLHRARMLFYERLEKLKRREGAP